LKEKFGADWERLVLLLVNTFNVIFLAILSERKKDLKKAQKRKFFYFEKKKKRV
jgi:hypothetical protein